MSERQLPAGAEFMSLAAVERAQRTISHRPRFNRAHDDNVIAIQHKAFGPGDGLLEPTSWEGRPIRNRDWIVKDLIPCGCVTMLSGNGGEGKSRLALQLLISAASGAPWLGREVKSVKALGVYCEDEEDELHRRSSEINTGEGIDFSRHDGLTLISRKGMDTILFEADHNDVNGRTTPTYERLRRTVLDIGAEILVLDSLYNFFGGNENNRPQVMQFIGALDKIAMEMAGAVIIVAHPSRAGMTTGSGDGGSTAWHNAVRSRLYMHRRKAEPSSLAQDPQAKGQLILEPMKGNYGPPQDAIDLEWSQGRFVRAIDATYGTSADMFEGANRGQN